MANEIPQTHVLYIEASDLVQESHAPALEQLNCVVRQAFSAQPAIEALDSEEPFDLVIVGDVSKPVNDENPEPELSIIRKARQRNADIPILIFSSHNYAEIGRNNGATDFMRKPAGVNALIEFVRPYLLLSIRLRERSEQKEASRDKPH